MNKSELISEVASKCGITKVQAEKQVNEVFAIISAELEAGNDVSLFGFGNFKVKDRAARTGVNPATNQPMSIPATKAVTFKAAKVLKDAVDPNK